jgi:protein-L-isoaspartate(D-aspartate) O-methyltransferase
VKLKRARREYGGKIAAAASLRSRRLVDALAAVPREAFLGPGPWQIKRADETGHDYQTTPDDDPRHVYDNVLVALDAERNLNNGEPAFVLRCLDDLDLAPGDRFLHVGCGTGYYTAIAALAVAGGTVVGLELDPGLAERARQNLSAWPGVSIEAVDGSEAIAESFDAILVNAGATEPLPVWLDHLRNAGRLLVPMTVDLPEPWAGIGAGQMLLVSRQEEAYSARFVRPVAVFHCAGARSPTGMGLLRQAFLRGGYEHVCSLRRDEHDSNPSCWLHARRFCLRTSPTPGK